MTGVVDFVALAGYFLLMLSVGLYFARRQGSAETFYLADRTLGTGSVLGTTFSTFLGTGLVFTLASFGYQYGVGAIRDDRDVLGGDGPTDVGSVGRTISRSDEPPASR